MPPNPNGLGFPAVFQHVPDFHPNIFMDLERGNDNKLLIEAMRFFVAIVDGTPRPAIHGLGTHADLSLVSDQSFTAPFPVDAICHQKVVFTSDPPHAFKLYAIFVVCVLSCYLIHFWNVICPVQVILSCLRSSFQTLNPPNANQKVAWQGGPPWALVLCSFQPCSVLFGPLHRPATRIM